MATVTECTSVKHALIRSHRSLLMGQWEKVEHYILILVLAELVTVTVQSEDKVYEVVKILILPSSPVGIWSENDVH